ncbi:hypothetical protein EJB05_05929, partial [Eragrostis curvula]
MAPFSSRLNKIGARPRNPSGSPSNCRVQIRRWRRCSGTRLRGRVLWSGSETSTITSASRAHLHGGADLGRAVWFRVAASASDIPVCSLLLVWSGGSISTFKNLKMGGAPEDYSWRQSRKKY